LFHVEQLRGSLANIYRRSRRPPPPTSLRSGGLSAGPGGGIDVKAASKLLSTARPMPSRTSSSASAEAALSSSSLARGLSAVCRSRWRHLEHPGRSSGPGRRHRRKLLHSGGRLIGRDSLSWAARWRPGRSSCRTLPVPRASGMTPEYEIAAALSTMMTACSTASAGRRAGPRQAVEVVHRHGGADVLHRGKKVRRLGVRCIVDEQPRSNMLPAKMLSTSAATCPCPSWRAACGPPADTAGGRGVLAFLTWPNGSFRRLSRSTFRAGGRVPSREPRRATSRGWPAIVRLPAGTGRGR